MKTLSYVKSNLSMVFYKMQYDLNKELLKILPFYNTFIDAPEIKKLNNAELLKELPLYDELGIVKSKSAFSGYARSCKIEIVDKRDEIVQLKASKISTVNCLKTC